MDAFEWIRWGVAALLAFGGLVLLVVNLGLICGRESQLVVEEIPVLGALLWMGALLVAPLTILHWWGLPPVADPGSLPLFLIRRIREANEEAARARRPALIEEARAEGIDLRVKAVAAIQRYFELEANTREREHEHAQDPSGLIDDLLRHEHPRLDLGMKTGDPIIDEIFYWLDGYTDAVGHGFTEVDGRPIEEVKRTLMAWASYYAPDARGK